MRSYLGGRKANMDKDIQLKYTMTHCATLSPYSEIDMKKFKRISNQSGLHGTNVNKFVEELSPTPSACIGFFSLQEPHPYFQTFDNLCKGKREK